MVKNGDRFKICVVYRGIFFFLVSNQIRYFMNTIIMWSVLTGVQTIVHLFIRLIQQIRYYMDRLVWDSNLIFINRNSISVIHGDCSVGGNEQDCSWNSSGWTLKNFTDGDKHCKYLHTSVCVCCHPLDCICTHRANIRTEKSREKENENKKNSMTHSPEKQAWYEVKCVPWYQISFVHQKCDYVRMLCLCLFVYWTAEKYRMKFYSVIICIHPYKFRVLNLWT